MPRLLPRFRRTGTAILTALLLAGTAALAGCTAHASDADADSGQMLAGGSTLDYPMPKLAGTTRLVDQDGHHFSLSSLRGKVVVLAPFLTLCQETCPMVTANMYRAAAVAQRAGLAGKVDFLELTVDPDRDTVSRIRAYAKLYGPALPDWSLATGRSADVDALWAAVGVSTKKIYSDDTVRDWLTGKRIRHPYDVQHEDLVMVIDPSGRVRWMTIGNPDDRGHALPRTLQGFLSAEGERNHRHPDAHGAGSWTTQDVERVVAYARSLDGQD